MGTQQDTQFASPDETVLPFSIYDISLSSASGKETNILSSQKGKVTLLFNVAAGCGNIPQHNVLEEINQIYKNDDNFSILAVVVDDFACHGYPEFQNGIQAYIDENALNCTVGEASEEYAQKHFNVTYEFSELTNGRHDKHRYDADFVPGLVKEQEQHILWSYLTGAHHATMCENGIPANNELVTWSNVKEKHVAVGAMTFSPLTGNFTKFLVDKTGTRVKRYQNGFLLGERGIDGTMFPWRKEKYQPDGRRDHNPDHSRKLGWETLPPRTAGVGQTWPNMIQRAGADVSISLMLRDINAYLAD